MMPDPRQLPALTHRYRWFARLRDEGTWETINHNLAMRHRERVGREARPSAAVMDSQRVRRIGSGGIRSYDGVKKINGRKRHALVDTDGRALKLHAHAASVQNRDGARALLCASRPSWPSSTGSGVTAGSPKVSILQSPPQRLSLRRLSYLAAPTTGTLINR